MIRIATAALIWAEWAAPLRPVHHLDDPITLVLGTLFLLTASALFIDERAALPTLLLGLPLTHSIEQWLLLCAVACLRAGPIANRLVLAAFFGASILHQLTPAFLSGLRYEQLLLARYGVWVGPRPLLAVAAVATVCFEAALSILLWTRHRRSAVLVGVLVCGLAYLGLYLGTLGATLALLLLGSGDGWARPGVVDRVAP